MLLSHTNEHKVSVSERLGVGSMGKCVGWHDLTEEHYVEKKAAYEAKKAAK